MKRAREQNSMGIPYEEWKRSYQREASAEQRAQFEQKSVDK